MKPAMAAALALGIALLAAEVVRPTTIPPKVPSHPSLVRAAGGPLPLTQEQLDDLPPILEPALGNIDGLRVFEGNTVRLPLTPERLRGNESFDLTGWCADPEALGPGAGLILVVDGSRRIDVSAGYGHARDDVGRLYKTPAMTLVGFEVRLSPQQIGGGAHTLGVALVSKDGRGIFLFPTLVALTLAP